MIICTLLITGFMVEARDYKVRATVADSLGKAAEYMTWRVFSATDSVRPVAGGVTPADGRVDAVLPEAGKYRFNVVSLETAPLDVVFEVSDNAPEANLGKLVTSPASKDLAELVITAQKPLVIKEIDRLGYDVKADDEAKTSTLDKILRKVPMVTVDEDGTIRVNGGTDFKIYKNGRPNKSFSSNAKDIFKALPASSIKKIEVITDPGAREDAEGATAILNIVTDSEMSMDGIMGNVGLNMSTNSPVPSGNLYFMTQIKKFTMSFYGGEYSYNSSQARRKNVSEGVFESTGTRMRSEGKSSAQGIGGYGGAELSYELDTLNLFTAEIQLWTQKNKSWSTMSNEQTTSAGDLIYSYLSRNRTPRMTYLDFDGTLNYQRSTRLKGETITLSYQVSTQRNRTLSEEEYEEMINMPVLYDGIHSSMRQNFIEHTAQLDWSRPLGSMFKFDVGGKYIYRDNRARNTIDYLDYDQMDSYDDFSHSTNIGAIYNDWRFQYGKWGARAGVRYEYSRMSQKYRTGDHKDYGANFNDWVPNVAVNYQINDANSIKVTFGRRIMRPTIHVLDPTVVESPLMTSSGNPNLKSCYINSYQINYNIIKAKYNFDLTVAYNNSNDGFLQTEEVIDDHIYRTYKNAGKASELRVSAYGQVSFGDKTRVYVNGSYRLQRAEDPTRNIHLTRPNFNFYLGFTQKLPWSLSLRLNAGYWSGWAGSLYSYSKAGTGGLWNALGLEKSFLKEDRLSVALGVENPFGPYKNAKYTQYNVNSDYKQVTRSYQLRNEFGVSLRVSYRFGSLRASVKKVARSISNDDMQKSSGGGQGGQGGK